MPSSWSLRVALLAVATIVAVVAVVTFERGATTRSGPHDAIVNRVGRSFADRGSRERRRSAVDDARRAPSTSVLLIGDSIVGLAGQRAAAHLQQLGVPVFVDAVGGSSPIGEFPGNVDWVSRAVRDARRYHPGTAIVMFTGNYPRKVTLPADEALCHEWGAATRQIVETLLRSGTGRVVVAESVPGRWSFDPDAAYGCEVEAIKHLPVAFIDAGGAVGAVGSPRRRVDALPACDGGPPVTVRTKDIHVTFAGADRIGRFLAAVVDTRIAPPAATCADRVDGTLAPPSSPAVGVP